MKYDSIIDLPHFEPKRHPRMSMDSRAAQFAPFAALEGHDEALQETSRITTERYVLSQYEKAELSRKLSRIAAGKARRCKIEYFVQDRKKSGGEYREVRGEVNKIDLQERKIFLSVGIVVELDKIRSIELLDQTSKNE